ncbi:hypothetical protein BAT02nite_00220 [Bacillus atrophaeus]|nr:hypothetical protein BAT02nite_00220 [Bacillus atrophaeus]
MLDAVEVLYRQNSEKHFSYFIHIEEDVNQQLSLFEKDNEKKRKLGFVMDGVRNKYGSKSILRAVSYMPAGTALYRAALTGGHKS